jgi:hypothetical protein
MSTGGDPFFSNVRKLSAIHLGGADLVSFRNPPQFLPYEGACCFLRVPHANASKVDKIIVFAHDALPTRELSL